MTLHRQAPFVHVKHLHGIKPRDFQRSVSNNTINQVKSRWRFVCWWSDGHRASKHMHTQSTILAKLSSAFCSIFKLDYLNKTLLKCATIWYQSCFEFTTHHRSYWKNIENLTLLQFTNHSVRWMPKLFYQLSCNDSLFTNTVKSLI